MGGMVEVLRNGWKIPDLRRKILFTLGMLVVFRIVSFIPVPGMDPAQFEKLVSGGALFGLLDIVSGGAFKQASIVAMSITPYINASIIIQLLTIAIPKLEQLAKEGEEGRKILGRYTRYGTVLLGFIQAIGLYLSMSSALIGGTSVLAFFTVTFSFTAGTAFLMWLGEQITEKGIGNGISLIIFAGIISRGPQLLASLYTYLVTGTLGEGLFGVVVAILIIAVFIGIIAAVVWVQQAERRIPVQYAKRVVGRKMYGGQSTHLPIKVNLAGVIPIIFAMSIMMLPQQIISIFFANTKGWFIDLFKNMNNSIWYSVINGLLIIFFTFFYTVIQFNPVEISNNLKKNGGFIPGIRPGKPTSDYISKILNKITWFGGLFLALVTIFPVVIGQLTGVNNVFLAGTSVLILVGVALDTIKQIESQMLMRHYKGFLE